MLRYVFFDLDGTLTQSEEGIFNCIRYALKEMGKPLFPKETLRRFIGPPLLEGFTQIGGFSVSDAETAVRLYRERYAKLGWAENRVYDGVEEMLQKAKEKGYILCVASSKPEKFVKLILEKFRLNKYFSETVGATLDKTRNTKEEVIAEALRRTNARKEEVVMVGDKEHDVSGARTFGIPCIAVGYGYGTQEELQAAKPFKIVQTVKELEETLFAL